MDKSKTKTKTLKEKKEKETVEMMIEITSENVVSEKARVKETELATESDYASPLQIDATARSDAETSRLWVPRTPIRAKRRRQDQVSESSTDVEIMGPPTSGSVKKKGACRKSEFLKREEGRQTSESELEQLARQAEASRLALGLVKDKPNDERSAGDLKDVAKAYLGLVQKVASKSRNLKGTSVRYLKDAAEVINTIVEVLISRTSSEETAVLQAENVRRQTEIAALKKEMAQLREEVVQAKKVNISAPKPVILRKEQPSTSSQMEEITRTIMMEVGNMVARWS